ncbi:hypothetical protein [Streptomyces sp. bgisy153]|uniref:hypothetical protein n=1 Tax=Streptomyces sp. bgisy153 TaxID=3413793 RepID=UPI003D75B053
MSSDTVTGSQDADALQRLTVLVWRAELLVDVEERVEQVTCRGEDLPYRGPSKMVADWRRQVEALRIMLGQPPAASEVDEAIGKATRLVQLLEQRGGQGADGEAETAAPAAAG